MKKVKIIRKLSQKDIDFLINVCAYSEIYINGDMENCKDYYGTSQKLARKKLDTIMLKLEAFKRLNQ
jgi:hypothetical protein